MKVLAAAEFEAGSQKAHAINVVKMAQGFARLGHEVTLVCRRPEHGERDVRSLERIYGLSASLRWVQLPRHVGGLPTHRESQLLSWLMLGVAGRLRPHLAYVRAHRLPALTAAWGFPTVVEKHSPVGDESPGFVRLVRASRHERFRTWVTISHRLAAYYTSRGVPSEKVCVLPDAVDLRLYRRPSTLPPSPYPPRGAHAAYVGHLHDVQGIPTILGAADRLPDVSFHLVGGDRHAVARHRAAAARRGLRNVVFHGLQPQAEVPRFLWHADVLLLPPSEQHPNAAWMSPMKLAEYLASGTPVVATSLLALRDWVTDQEVEFVAADDSAALADGVRAILRDPGRATRMSTRALRKAMGWSFEQRVEQVLAQADISARRS